MPKPYRIILGLAICLTICVFVHEAIYDKPSEPYPLSQTINDLLFFGSICTGVFFGLMAGPYYLLSKLYVRMFRRRAN